MTAFFHLMVSLTICCTLTAAIVENEFGRTEQDLKRKRMLPQGEAKDAYNFGFGSGERDLLTVDYTM
eukprot:scaffold122773_cov45-Attheya_sp.AAC.3